jgi:hypothetical protein
MKDALEALNFRSATAADRPRLIPLISSAFAIATFLEGTRTNDASISLSGDGILSIWVARIFLSRFI